MCHQGKESSCAFGHFGAAEQVVNSTFFISLKAILVTLICRQIIEKKKYMKVFTKARNKSLCCCVASDQDSPS